MGIFICYICEGSFPTEFLNKHHKIPESMGGSSNPDNLVALCAGCHQFLHAIARMMRNPKRVGEIRSSVQNLYPDSGSQKRCMELSHLVVQSGLLEREKVQNDPESEVNVGLKLKRPYKDALQLLARDRGLSMSNYVRKIMEDHIRKAYPTVEKGN